MAKKNDHDFATENTEGVLSGFLADEEQLDRRGMFRLGTWGAASVGAVIVAVLANQSSLRLRHDEIAAADLSRQARQIQTAARETENETRRLASAVDTLNGDRDRMYTRLSTLEQGLESVTGAIAKQKNAATTPAPAASPTPAANSAPAAASAAQGTSSAPEAAAEPAPPIGPVASTLPTIPVKPATETKRRDQTVAKVANASLTPAPASTSGPVASAPGASPSNAPATTASLPIGPTKSIMGPPDPAAPKMIEPEPAKTAAVGTPSPTATQPTPVPVPETTAMVPAADKPPGDKSPGDKSPGDKPLAEKPAAEKSASEKLDAQKPVPGQPAIAEAAPEAPAQIAVNRTEFGVDVGGANSIGGLRALWRGLLKSRSNAPLAALQPIIVIKESTNGLGMQLRLVAGPLNDAAAAARICAKMVENERPCATTVYDGQRLAVKSDDAPASTGTISPRAAAEKPSERSGVEKPAEKPKSGRQAWRRHSYSRRAVVVEEAPKKPESTAGGTISSFFHRGN
jgi:hypothetical protein